MFDNIARGHGCKACAREAHKSVCAVHFQKYSVDDVLSILKSNGYTWLNQEEYINASSMIEFQCDKCGHIARSNFSHIHSGRMCRGCSQYKKKTTSEFAEIVSKVDEGYDLLSEYKTCKDKVMLRHKLCGHVFEMTPDGFIGGSRCPHCMASHGELEIKRHLDNRGVSYIQQYRFDDCRNIKPLPFDFYLPELSTCIEYNGQQHYRSVEYFGGDDGYEYRRRNDEIKRSYCDENGISLVVIPYWEFGKIGGVIDGLMSKTR